MKKATKRILSWVLLSITLLSSFFTFAFATVTSISNIATSRLVYLQDETFGGSDYLYVGAIGTSGSVNSVYSLKSEAGEQYGAFYYYPNLSTIASDKRNGNYGIYRLKHAGHANGMTTDSNNVYVTGWTSNASNQGQGNQQNNTYNNWILMIPKSTIENMPLKQNGKLIPKDDKTTPNVVEGFSVLYPKVKNVAANGSISYAPYTDIITGLAKYSDADNSFLIPKTYRTLSITAPAGQTLPTEIRTGFAYTKARLETHNGQTLFVVSEDPDDMFIVKNSFPDANSIGQDMCYKANCGFFMPRYYRNTNASRNGIGWVDIDGNNYENVTLSNGNTYKVFTPVIIDVDKSTSQSGGINKFSTFEIESLAITSSNKMIMNVESLYTPAYAMTFDRYDGTNLSEICQADSIFDLTFNNGQNFLLSNMPTS